MQTQQEQTMKYSWQDLFRRNKPDSDEPPTAAKRPRIARMKSRRLKDNEICVHNRTGCRAVTIGQLLSEQLYNEGFKYASVDYIDKKIIISFYKDALEGKRCKLTYNLAGKKPHITFSRKSFVDSICQYYGLSEGNYYIAITQPTKFIDNSIEVSTSGVNESQPIAGKKPIEAKPSPPIPQDKKKRCIQYGKVLPVSEFYPKSEGGYQSRCKECDKEHGRLRNGTTGEYRDPAFQTSLEQKAIEYLKSISTEERYYEITVIEHKRTKL